MKHPKRFCVGCVQVMPMVIRPHKTFSMYHCRKCGQQICRVGDGDIKSGVQRVRGGIDVRSISEDALDGKPSGVLACENPDVLSDEHGMWPASENEETEKADKLSRFMEAFNLLTPRQKEIALAVERYGTQDAAAKKLGITRGTIAQTLTQIKNRLNKLLNNSHKQGILGSHTHGDENAK